MTDYSKVYTDLECLDWMIDASEAVLFLHTLRPQPFMHRASRVWPLVRVRAS